MVSELEPWPTSSMSSPHTTTVAPVHTLPTSASDLYGPVTPDSSSNAASSNIISGLINNSINTASSSFKGSSIRSESDHRKILSRRNDAGGDGTDDYDDSALERRSWRQGRAQRILEWIVVGWTTRVRNSSSIGTSRADGGPTIKKNYQVFTGDLQFLFGGRMISSRGKPLNMMILFILLVAGGLFFAVPVSSTSRVGFGFGFFFLILTITPFSASFSAPWYWRVVSPAVPITFAYLYLFALASFVKA